MQEEVAGGIADGHRPWPAPRSPWLIRQLWENTIFLHWPLAAETVKAALPGPLQPYLDVHQGSAWIGVVGFKGSGTRLNNLPEIPILSEAVELNVRTYITIDDKPGVYFFSLDTFNLLACAGARLFFDLPYFPALTDWETTGDKVLLKSARFSETPARFEALYRPLGPAKAATLDEFSAFLLERYCLYGVRSSGGLFRVEIHHRPWRVSKAEVELRENTMTAPLGLTLSESAPVMHVSEIQEAFIWGTQDLARPGRRPAEAAPEQPAAPR
ncbi:MAG: DUF2071 domain-containing protein [Elusimicrobia bacterium]|nr:DUF2071 domain-containing protein [Elusimicrobiota bacterium]